MGPKNFTRPKNVPDPKFYRTQNIDGTKPNQPSPTNQAQPNPTNQAQPTKPNQPNPTNQTQPIKPNQPNQPNLNFNINF